MKVFVSPRYLELLAQRMRNAGIRDIEIEGDWINTVNSAMQNTEYRYGLENEFAEEEIRLVKKRIEAEDPVARALRNDGVIK